MATRNPQKIKRGQVQKILDDSTFRSLDRSIRRDLHEKIDPSKFPRPLYISCMQMPDGRKKFRVVRLRSFSKSIGLKWTTISLRLGFAEEI